MGTNFDGLLVLDKPAGITSRDAVDRALRWFPRKTRIGHAGTLDPLATGVLVLCVGQATRLTEYVQRMSKHYQAEIQLGATSDTDDADGAITPFPDARVPNQDDVERELISFVGAIDQLPPSFSAAKITGRRAYDLARKGQDVILAPRTVSIHAIDIQLFTYPRLDVVVRCGKGTYIRSIARDLGQRLGCGGYITALRRLAIGPFTANDALHLDASFEQARARLLPIAQATRDLTRITLTPAEIQRLRHGQSIAVPAQVDASDVAVFDDEDRLRAIGTVIDGQLRPSKVLV
ncbi:MAG: tRNA pseudouridine(55) synthase TruB [Planctomycetes bacterium]|nr:tRNA pseudouridine(55) synthase TruB [Planctomycetota bacterium]